MNSYYRELLSPQTGIAAQTLTVTKGLEVKKHCLTHHLPLSVYSTNSSNVRFRTSAVSSTRGQWYAVRHSNHSATQLVPLMRQNDVFKLNV